MTTIYGVTGMPLAGKTTVASVLEENGYSVLDMGDVVRKEREKRDIPVSETGTFVNEQREKRGMDAIAQLSIPYLEDLIDETDKIVITGMRGWMEKERFEAETQAEIEVIAVWASRETRKQRMEQRQRDEDIEGDSFHERDLRDLDNGVGKLIALSDHLIKNDSITETELEKRIEELV
ncbi:MAG: AAA family ATPase [Candidatus Nanohaloarchaeota archaeon QJJ-5]|nr:AAA family ATPase [Candidatus Nanohaloarchaeota archaeon QJJ-5]